MEADNEFMQAIYINDINFIACCLKGGINVNKICSNGMTPLGAAAQTGNLAVLKTLIDHHCCSLSNYRSENKDKPQYLQLDSDNQKRCKNIGYFVVCRDVDETEFGDGPTPDGMEGLEWDMEINETQFSTDEETVEDSEINMYKWYANILNRTSMLLDSPERDVGRLDRHGQSILHYAVNTGNIEMVEYLMASVGKDLSVNQNDAFCFSPLHMASANGDFEMVRWLLRRGANANTIGGRLRQSPLHIAARGGNVTIVKALIEAGADVNVLDIDEKSMLTLAIRHGNEEAIKYLVRAGARVNHEEPGGVTPLRIAVWANQVNIIQLLLENSARIVHSHHLMHTACTYNNLDIVRMLVEHGAMVNAKDDQGTTPLMVACSRKNIPIAKYLILHGADVNAASHIDGKTALHVCVQDVREAKCVHQLIDLLVRHGADLNAPSYQGSVLFYSILLENRSATTALVQQGIDVNMRDERAYVDNLSLAKRHGDLNLVKLLVYSGFRPSGMTWDPHKLRTKAVDPACDFILYVRTNPLSLRDLCRITIRKQIGPKNIISRIYTLPLPTILHKYLALEIL